MAKVEPKKAKFSDHLLKGGGKLSYLATNSKTSGFNRRTLSLGVPKLTVTKEYTIILKVAPKNLKNNKICRNLKGLDWNNYGMLHGTIINPHLISKLFNNKNKFF